MESKRIGFDGRFINDRYHGIGRYAYSLLDQLSACYPQTQWVVFTGPQRDRRFDWERLKSRSNVEMAAGPPGIYRPNEQLAWPAILDAARLNAFYSPYFVAPLLARVPVIITIHDLIFERYPEYMPSRWVGPLYSLVMRAMLMKARKVVTVSQTSAADLRKYYGLKDDRVVVVPEGAGPDFYPVCDPKTLEQVRKKYHLYRPFILTVGARRPHKNQATLVWAYAQMNCRNTHDLVIIGSPDARFTDQALKAAGRLELSNRVRFIDWAGEEDLPALYSLADATAFVSLVEGFGLPALEAMACGAPVVVSQGTSLAEVVGEAGLKVDPRYEWGIARALDQLISDGPMRQELADRGRERSRAFNWSDTARLVYETIQGVCAPHD
jgi:glycosyltransferase involved in cell wall biosynthesis